jgi:hypothetical protein
MPDSQDINFIATELNNRASLYRIGQLQFIRKALKRFERLPSRDIFTRYIIHKDWASHHGGRTELQFNIGFENIGGSEELRHGVGELPVHKRQRSSWSSNLKTAKATIPRVRASAMPSPRCRDSAVLDGEAVLMRPDNSFDFEGLRSRQGQAEAILVAYHSIART